MNSPSVSTWRKIFLSRCFGGVLFLFFSLASAQQMRFELLPPAEPVEVLGNAWHIYADGEIDSNAAGRLNRLIQDNKIPPRSTLSINSRGGTLLGGMALGRVIRENGLNTDVLKRGQEIVKQPSQSIKWKSYEELPGECFSACALAYVGGIFRFINQQAKFGVHRFYSKGYVLDSDSAQIASGTVIAYLGEMGVKQGLFSEMAKAGRDEINLLPRQLLLSLAIANEGNAQAVWSIESAAGALYLKGERETRRGINKFIVLCEKKQLYIHVIFDPEGRGEQILNMEAQSLFVDEKTILISSFRVGKQSIVNGLVNALYKLSPDFVTNLQSARSVGIAFQYLTTAQTFLGFQGMEIDSQKLGAYLGTCR